MLFSRQCLKKLEKFKTKHLFVYQEMYMLPVHLIALDSLQRHSKNIHENSIKKNNRYKTQTTTKPESLL